MTKDQPTALRLADKLIYTNMGDDPIPVKAAAELRRLHEINEAFGKRQEWWNERMFKLEAENEALRSAVTKLHKAKGRYHTQIAAAALYELCGLPAEKVKI